ncbi:MAG: fibronectin type III domain-containing protein, partial [Anaerolineae bacterium]
LDATGNYWGTTITTTIEAMIYDWYDDPTKGLVDYSGYLNAQSPCAPPVPEPEIGVTPAAFDLVLEEGGSATEDLTIENTGIVALGFTITDTVDGAPIDWLTEVPNAGSVDPGSSQVVEVTFNAGSLTAGTYNADIVIDNDDPDENPTTVPVTLTVTSPPEISDVRTTNVRDTSFTVSWLTDVEAGGEVHYGTDPANLNQSASDDRGTGTFDDTHYATLMGLTPNTTYYFDVVSGSTTDDNGGAHYSLTTGPTLGLPGSDTIYGQVFKNDGTTPAEGTIVYVTLRDADGGGSSGEAAPLSALVDDTGYWTTNLGNARLADLSAYFTYSPSGDQVRLEAQGSGDGAGYATVDTGDDTPAPPIVLSSIQSRDISLQIGWNHISLPLDPFTSYTAESMCDEINSQGGNVAEIDRWHTGGWDGHICGLPFNDFPIELGADYFIRSDATSVWTILGYAVTAGVPLDLQIGWNSIGVPHTDAYTAESLCDEIISQGVTAVEIDRWYAGGWEGHICGLPFNDFPIEIGKGYFVKADSSGTVILTALAFQSQQAEPAPAAPPEAMPATAVAVRDLQVSNLRDTALALSWITDEPATGYVVFGETPALSAGSGQALSRVAYDVRGPDVAADAHYVVLTGLAPETTYYFDVVSGAGVDDNGGAHYTVTTGPQLDSLPEPDTVYGQVFRANRITPAVGTIVYLTLMDGDGLGSAGQATLMSALVDAEGYWNANLGNARLADGSDSFAYSASGDAVTLLAQGAAVVFITRTVENGDVRPAAPLVPVWRFQLYLPMVTRE